MTNYQIMISANGAENHAEKLCDTILLRLKDLGNESGGVTFPNDATISSRGHKAPTVGAFLSSTKNPARRTGIAELVQAGSMVVPVVDAGGHLGNAYFNKYIGILGNTNANDASNYRGRGYVQITGRSNYQHWSNELGMNLVQHPTLAATPEVAAQIAVEGLDQGSFTGVSLYNFVNSSKTDFLNARTTINRMDQAGTIAASAQGFASALSHCRQ